MLTGLGRKLLDACMTCEDFGVEAVQNGRLIARCDKGNISGCLQRFNVVEQPIGYI